MKRDWEQELPPLDVLIVGGGLFGQIIGKHLKRQGRTVTIMDAELMGAASPAAACLMKPSWLTKMSKTDQATAMAVLDENYGVHEIEAHVAVVGTMGKRTTIYWVAPASILKPENVVKQTVTKVGTDGDNGDQPWYRVVTPVADHPDLGQDAYGRANLIIVAAGIFCNELLPQGYHVPNLSGQWGAAFTWPCDPDRESRVSIRAWAPYKQLVCLPNRRPGELWIGDGTALKNLTQDRIRASAERCASFQGLGTPEHQLIGARPYVKGLSAPAYLKEVRPNLWVATGGAKNGTAGAAWAAHKLAQATN